MLIRLAALCLCAVLYCAALFWIFQGLEKQRRSVSPIAGPMNIDFVQMELQTEPAPPPEPEPVPEQEMLPEESEDADVALENVPEKPKPEPKPAPPSEPLKPDVPIAKVTQKKVAPMVLASPEQVQGWVFRELENVKYFPPAAERLGLKGTFDLTVTVDKAGTILSAQVLDGKGHRILRQALEKMLAKLIGLRFGKPLDEAKDFEFTFEFE